MLTCPAFAALITGCLTGLTLTMRSKAGARYCAGIGLAGVLLWTITNIPFFKLASFVWPNHLFLLRLLFSNIRVGYLFTDALTLYILLAVCGFFALLPRYTRLRQLRQNSENSC